jgi:soluble lytic murein transglycosylase-like protein
MKKNKAKPMLNIRVWPFWAWCSLLIVGLFVFPIAANKALTVLRPIQYSSDIAPLFTQQVQYWGNDIARWAQESSVDPNLIATIMQIESCGHPTVISHAGAQGLFQVMPFHFSSGEDMLAPDTNARRSTNFIRECYNYANGDVGLVMACYNGGPSVTYKSFANWPDETKRYYVWGLGIYIDAAGFSNHSDTLDQWLSAGGSNLCNMASATLGLQ